jgi:Tc toxin complex TcA C-terminal TcB-binding domain
VATEITQIYKQLRAAQIREAIAEREWHNHQQQIRNAEEIERFLTDPKTGKTSQQALYTWLRREVRGLYSQCFQFAFEVAKKAERALQHELGDPNRTFLQYGYQSERKVCSLASGSTSTCAGWSWPTTSSTAGSTS